MTEQTQEELPRLKNLVCYTTKFETKQKYHSKILNKTFYFSRHKVTEYLDMKTGEIISSIKAKQIGVMEFNYEPLTKEKNTILDSLRKEIRDFAKFVLLFRNKRRGLSPNLGQVVVYYSKYTGKRENNIKSRLLPNLMGKVIFSETLMMPPFQINDRFATAAEHLQEDFAAENKFFMMMQRKGCVVEEVA